MSTLSNTSPLPPATAARRALWLKQLHQWHWISSALCLLGMLLFSVSGFTLNHASQIEAHPKIRLNKGNLPPALQQLMRHEAARLQDGKAPLPAAVQEWARHTLALDARETEAEWSMEEIYVALPRPGGDAWLRIAANGSYEAELTDRGWISWINDVHKGRHTGTAWRWFIDLFALACLLFCVTGFLILKYHAANRRSTWPVIGIGVLLPVLLLLLFVH